MEKREIIFTLDPCDLDAMRKLMDKLSTSKTMYFGANENFEETEISIFKEKIVCTTYQHNGWIRKNIYWRDGTREEIFNGRWRTSTRIHISADKGETEHDT